MPLIKAFPLAASSSTVTLITVLIAGSLTAGACGRLRDSQDVDSRSPAMILFDGASRVQYFRNHETTGRLESEQLVYLVEREFPATEVICRIVADLKRAGWRPLDRTDDDVRTESSYTEGWRSSISLKGMAGEAQLDGWHAPWINQRGDYLSYSLVFRYPAAEPRDGEMQIGALLTPAHLVKAFKMSVGDPLPDSLPPRITPAEIAECPD